jgi:hypothetical protein
MKQEPIAATLEEIEFCQCRIVDVDGPLFVRNCFKAFDTDYCCYFDNWDATRYRELIHAIGGCGLSLTAGCPVMQSWYQFGLRCGVKASSKRITRELWNTGLYRQAMLEGGYRKAKPISVRSRLSFERAFGVTVAEQLMLEAHFDGMSIDCAVDSSLDREIFTFTPLHG